MTSRTCRREARELRGARRLRAAAISAARRPGSGGGLVLALTLPGARGSASARSRGRGARDAQLNAWLEIGADDSDHRPGRSLGDGTGRLHRPAHAARRGARDRSARASGHRRAGGRCLCQRRSTAARSPAPATACRTPGRSCARPAPRRALMLIAAAAQRWHVDPAGLPRRRTARVDERARQNCCATASSPRPPRQLPVPKDVTLKAADRFPPDRQTVCRGSIRRPKSTAAPNSGSTCSCRACCTRSLR